MTSATESATNAARDAARNATTDATTDDVLKSNLGQRVIVGVIVAPLMLFLIHLGDWFFFAMIFIISLAALYEFQELLRAKNIYPNVWLVLFCGSAITLTFQLRAASVQDVIFGAVMLLVAVELWRRQGSPMQNLGGAMLGLFYISVSLGTLLPLRNADGSGLLTMLVVLCVWASDTFAYFGGRFLGGKIIKRKLFERISPKKTWEGFFTGLIGCLATAHVFWIFLLQNEYPAREHIFGIALLIGALGPVGDLIESMFKRDSGLKDSSGLIPGHGGFFDRFDSLCFIAPLVFLYAKYVMRLL
ncbi:MAG: phosphatidate cytidylyltransferase [Rhizobacter sp.]|nr:phosphatidate cytidylyltransferase [Chlorobiales bacterium]